METDHAASCDAVAAAASYAVARATDTAPTAIIISTMIVHDLKSNKHLLVPYGKDLKYVDVCVYETCGVSDVNAFGTARTSMFKATRLNSNAHM